MIEKLGKATTYTEHIIKTNEIIDYINGLDKIIATSPSVQSCMQRTIDLEDKALNAEKAEIPQEAFDLGEGATCEVCKKRMCQCPERQKNGDWIEKAERCPTCSGDGDISIGENRSTLCPQCNGTGKPSVSGVDKADIECYRRRLLALKADGFNDDFMKVFYRILSSLTQ